MEVSIKDWKRKRVFWKFKKVGIFVDKSSGGKAYRKEERVKDRQRHREERQKRRKRYIKGEREK